MIRRKKNNDLEQIFSNLELAVQDDMALFLEFGEDYFTLEELEALYASWENEFQRTDKMRGRFVLLCASSIMLIPISAIIGILGYGAFLPVFIVCFPIFFLVGVGGFLTLYFKYGRVAYQENVGRRLKFAIRNKLQKRGFSKDFEI